ncbi:MAG: DNA/RNA nuclease SfsA [Oscillospiraceae bacterium]|nr:DNA/RNA nuclease SfsA [Oscillospiraceae bacterium]
MKYNNIIEGIFISRPNRFIANVMVDEKVEIVHVKNTGRCKELLVEGARVFLEKSDNINRKTKYDLVSVYKGDRLINMDSQMPNKLFYEWVLSSSFFKDIVLIKPEYTYKKSRLDFFIETKFNKYMIEVKGVTLERDKVALFPDAPTIRGVKHINHLIEGLEDGFISYIFFIIQMDNIDYFTPNYETDICFFDSLNNAENKGVRIIALYCNVSINEIFIKDFTKIILKKRELL